MQCYCHCRFLPLPASSSSYYSSIDRISDRLHQHQHQHQHQPQRLCCTNANAASPSPSPSPDHSLHQHKHQRQRQRQSLIPHQNLSNSSAIHRISHKLRRLGYVPQQPSPSAASASPIAPSPSPGEIFIPTPPLLPPFRLASTLQTPPPPPPPPPPHNDPLPSLAHLSLPPPELRRLQTLGIRLRHKLRLGKPGITEGFINTIHERWKRSELVKIKCQDLSRLNTKHTHHLLETKIDGFVVWRSGSIIILYRDPHYTFPYFPPPKRGGTGTGTPSPQR